MRHPLHRALDSDRGATAVEFALVCPVFLLMLIGVCEFGRLIFTQSVLDYAVESAARCGAFNTVTCNTTTTTQNYASQKSSPLTIPVSAFTASKPACGSQVSASYAFTFVVPKLFPRSVTLTATACTP